jgi:ATPase family associated with various cellular activities (AAA)
MPLSEKTQLALTMRPRSFSDVIGLEIAVKTAKTEIDAGNIPRGFLIVGPYGCGKTTLAHIISHYIQGPLFDGHPAVQEVNGANYRKIENMRTLAESAGSYPMVGTYSVIIMDECHQLTKDAQQILLKELEVPKSPTVWILATTDPDKLNEGIRGRCFILTVEGMDAVQRHELLERAAKEKGHGDFSDFEAAITKAKVVSPRKILNAFETYHSGTPAVQAVAAMCLSISPEYHDIAFAVCFGQWDKSVQMFGGNVTVKPVGQLLKELDERLKKKPASDGTVEEKEDVIEDDDLDSKQDAALALRAVVGAFLKGQVLPTIQKNNTFKFKPQEKMDRAYKAMHALANAIPDGAFELKWSGIMTTLYRVNSIMQGRP